MSDLAVRIDPSMCGRTVKDVLRTKLGVTSRLLSSLKSSGGLLLNGQNVTVRAVVREGDELRLVLPEKESQICPADIPIDVLYEDEHILAVNKPRNMQVHPSHSDFTHTLGNAVAFRYGTQNFVYRPLTRLDKNTSGVVLIGRSQYAAARLSEQLRSGAVKKTYVAVICGRPDPPSGVIDAPVAREREGCVRRCVRGDGKPSRTEYETLSACGRLCLVRLRPITGRTHQIRVHMSYIGHPLYNDFLYGDECSTGTYLLHCSSVEFIHPWSKSRVVVECSPDFVGAENSIILPT